MFKILQITDCHMLPPGETIFGSDPYARLAAAVADINRNHADAALCVLTGDLAHHADPKAYCALREVLSKLVVPYQLLLGNHDDRATLRAVFPELACDADGFVQSVRDMPPGRFIFLDTVDPGVHTGAYCERRRAWLSIALDESAGRPIYLFQHHPSFEIALPHLDQCRMADGGESGAIVGRHDNIRHLFSATFIARCKEAGAAFRSQRCAAPTTRTGSIFARSGRTSPASSRPPTQSSS